MGYDFRWNEWNINHIAEHGVSAAEAEYVVSAARRPYPTYQGDGRFMVRGQTDAGQWLQVVYIFSPADVVYVIHARPLTDRRSGQPAGGADEQDNPQDKHRRAARGDEGV